MDELTQAPPTLHERPWIELATTFDVEAWIDHLNRDLQQVTRNQAANGAGICFRLSEGGDIYLHTNGDGDVLLDVTPEAEWVAPVIAAATLTHIPATSPWIVPGHVLTQLIVGLSSLIGTTRLVLQHEFRPARSKLRPPR